MTHSQDIAAAEALFDQAQKQHGVLAILRSALNLGALIGFNGRTRNNRVKALRRSNQSKMLAQGLSGLGAAGLSYFNGLAVVNKEQAEAAFRYTAIVNFTAPITVLVIFNQIIEGGLMGVFETASEFDSWKFAALAASFMTIVIGVISYAYIGAQMARDILHLTTLEQARRGGFSAAAPDEDDGMVEPADL
ncbi:MAG: hypothetical protein CMH90_09615 [Oceanicaulis sp.]|uniref:hypothetical protein n=1 Tax=Oceanicaulis sp. UBA2681 TaxID=1947007 RepID=UPI000C09DBB9|nr:hypothetical protein [Oceanicaulis sp. UBA2681]MAP49724.1 hypothetical protein [Oceanicaulis sp.]VXC96089.1 conserved membrane hypothetical protein [Oceanicaulis sp. 350]HCR64974.1 hypothetical protein [Oceanicaulis sp.]|tara:strand:+ start:7250 stop:7822 length:573 start_codon:yes stop_codon:yes gene_type:complete